MRGAAGGYWRRKVWGRRPKDDEDIALAIALGGTEMLALVGQPRTPSRERH